MLPTNTEKKEELRNKFNDFCNNDNSCLFEVKKRTNVFDFFYSEIEQREADIITKDRVTGEIENELRAKLKAQEEILKAADEVIECVEINTETHFFSINWKIKEAIEKYTTLKQQQ